MVTLFLSYARADGEAQATEFRQRLAREATDIAIKQDRLFLEGGVGWWRQITEAIDSVEFLVLIVTPGAMRSGNVQNEWRYARQQGVCVYPVKGCPDSALHFDQMPRWMSKRHLYDLKEEWPTFVAHLRKGCEVRRVPFMTPELPSSFVNRPREFETLKKLIVSQEPREPIEGSTALAGAGGFGKTALSIALCHDDEIIEVFDDGILWITLGRTPDILGNLLTAYAALTGERPGFATREDAAFQVAQKLADRNCLMVIDDVWDADHLRPFLQIGKSSTQLYTTRDTAIASLASGLINVDEMEEGEAISMLTHGVAGLGNAEALTLARRLGEWPLALEMAASMMRQRTQHGESANQAATRFWAIIQRKGVVALQNPTAEQRHRTISGVIEVSLELLSDIERRNFIELSVFPEDTAIPIMAAGSVWGLDELDSEELAQRLARLSLIKLDLQGAVLRLHDIMRDWLTPRVADLSVVHRRLVKAWRNWRDLPDLPGSYAWHWLLWHLARGGQTDDIADLLWNPRWMLCKLKATDINALIADYKYLKPSPGAKLLEETLRLSAHVLMTDADQFASQMAGRLLAFESTPEIQHFIHTLAASAPRPWLRPLYPALHPPETPLLGTLEGHASSVYSIAITADGKRGVSASHDWTLKIWDLETGCMMRTLAGHASPVHGVALTSDGKRAISGSWDKTLKVWDLANGAVLQTMEGHTDCVFAVAVTPDNKRAISASRDKTLKIWDLDTGSVLQTLEGHANFVFAVAVAPDGGRAISGSWDNTLKVWDIQTGSLIHTLNGHTGGVEGVTVMPAGNRAVSASSDRTLRVWDLASGDTLLTIESFGLSSKGVAVTPDGGQVVSASRDHTVKVWDVESGRIVRALEGHVESVSDVAVAPNGKRAISVSLDNTLKVWDLTRSRVSPSLIGHSSAINGVAAIPGGSRAISASSDMTLKVWDLSIGSALQTLEGHSLWVYCVAVSADGKRAVSGSADGTTRVWDLETGRMLRTFGGHPMPRGYVLSVALTPDGTRAISAGHDSLKMWDIESGQLMGGITDAIDVSSVAVAPNGTWLVAASHDHAIRVWDLDTGDIMRTLNGHSAAINAITVTPNGKQVVSASLDKTVIVWDLETGRSVCTLEGHTARVDGVAVEPDGQLVVSASWDNTLKVWRLETGQLLATFHCDGAVNCCAFTDRKTIVTGDQGGRLHVLSFEE